MYTPQDQRSRWKLMFFLTLVNQVGTHLVYLFGDPLHNFVLSQFIIAHKIHCYADGLHNALVVGDPFTSYIEGGAVVDGCPDIWQPQVDADTPGPVMYLDRNVTLIVVHS